MYLDLRPTKRVVIVLMSSLIILVSLVCALVSNAVSAADKRSDDAVDLPIIMYHSILKENSVYSKYIVSPYQLEQDLVYIRDNGYTTITVSDLVRYVYDSKPLPEKVIMLTFDDGYYNNYHYMFPLLKKYNMRAVVSPVVSVCEEYTNNSEEKTVSYGYCSFEDIKEMQMSGFVEMANHSYDMHHTKGRSGINKMHSESVELYNTTVGADIEKAQQKLFDITGIKPVCMVYPLGAYCEDSEKLIKSMGFLSSMTCETGINSITRDVECLYKLKRLLRPPDKGIEQLIKQ